MSLHIFNDLEQGTEEWLAARRGMVTASVVGQLLTATGRPASNDTSRRLTLALVAERITGETEPVYMNDDMLRGHLEEPRARDMYAEHFSGGEIVSETGFMVRDDWGFQLGYSPDGLVGDDGLIEVKAPRAKGHIATILSGVVPDRHMPQIQAGLLVSGREWCDFISYYGGLPPFVKRVHADPKWAESIVAAVAAFEQAAVQMTERYDIATRGLPATERRIPLADLEVI
jgi:hypothetical protein